MIDNGYMEIHWEKDQHGNDVLREGEMRNPNMDEIDASRAAAAFGRKGGQARSGKKTAAARENGKKGGRPTIHTIAQNRLTHEPNTAFRVRGKGSSSFVLGKHVFLKDI